MRRLGPLVFLCLLPASAFAAIAGVSEYHAAARVDRAVPVVDRDVERIPVKRCTWELAPAALGGRRYERRPGHDRYFQRCTTRYESRVRENVRGYRVTFRHGGETFHERMRSDPGQNVRIQVRVAPIDE